MKTVLFLLLLGPLMGWAQTYQLTPADTQRKQSYLIMRDGSVVRGRVIRQDSSIITVRRRGGDMSFVEADQLLRISPERPAVAGEAGGEQTGLAARRTVFVLKDSSRVDGEFVRRDSTMITVRKRNGQLTYFEPELLVRVDSVPDETVAATNRVFTNQFSPWLLTGVTAYNPQKGRFYYRNTWLLLNEFDYGITRFWSVGASFIAPVPYLVYADDYYGWGQYRQTTPTLFTKISAPLGERFRMSLNAVYRANQNKVYPPRGGNLLLQALASIGSSQRNVTVGYGIGVPRAQYQTFLYPMVYSSSVPQYGRVFIPNQSFLSLGVVQKVSPGLTIVSDNRVNLGARYAYYTSERVTASLALRLDRRRHAFDLGLSGFIYQKPERWDNKWVRVLPHIAYNLLIGQD